MYEQTENNKQKLTESLLTVHTTRTGISFQRKTSCKSAKEEVSISEASLLSLNKNAKKET